jgi:alpha-tubulin suppressor-like RCC1 family protein
MWTWGFNQQGMLGINQPHNTCRSSPTQVPGTTWRSGSYNGGDNHMKATKTDGTLWIWGWQTGGNFGNNTSTPASSPVQIPGTDWDIAGGDRIGIALKTDDTLWVWGNNEHGQLGQNSTATDYSSPIQIPGTWSKLGGTMNSPVALKI